MKTERYQPEWRQFTDAATGACIRQWTSHEAMHHHFYFTNPSVSANGKQGFFISYRTGYPNLFAIDLDSGELTQLSARADINAFSPSPSLRGGWIFVSARDTIRAFPMAPGEERELCRLGSARLGNCSLNADGSLLAVSCRYDEYCELALVDTATGSVEILTRMPEIGHIQFCPADSTRLMFSGSVTQRIWIHDRQTGRNEWVYQQKPDEWIVHESWLGAGGEIIFPHWPKALRAIRPDGTGLRSIANLNAWHACSNAAGTRIVCDTNHPDRGLLLIDPATGRHRTLCHPRATLRGTQWVFDQPAVGAGIDTSIIRSATPEKDPPPHPDDPASVYGPQWSHPHPAFSPDGRSVIYTSDCDRWSQVYQVELPGSVDA